MNRLTLLVSVAFASFITPFMSSSINVALPSIANHFSVDAATVNWFANALLISMASTILLFGVVGDWIGRERVFVSGTLLFAVTSLSILVVKSFGLAVVLRCLQGVGAAMVSGTGVAILAASFPERMGLVIGINTAAVYIGSALGPALGGVVVDFIGWAHLFTLAGLVALSSFILSIASQIPLQSRGGGGKLGVLTLALFTTSSALISIGSAYAKTLYGLSMLLMGSTVFVYAMYIEYRKSLNLAEQIFEKRILLAYITALLNYAATFALSILYSNYLQIQRGFKAREVGLLLLTQSVSQALLSPLTGRLADKVDPGSLVATGMLLITAGIAFSTALYTSPVLLTPCLMIIGMGFAFFAPPNTAQIVRSVPRKAYASATSLLGQMRFLGQSLSTSILTLVITVSQSPTPMNIALTVYTAISVIGAATALLSWRLR